MSHMSALQLQHPVLGVPNRRPRVPVVRVHTAVPTADLPSQLPARYCDGSGSERVPGVSLQIPAARPSSPRVQPSLRPCGTHPGSVWRDAVRLQLQRPSSVLDRPNSGLPRLLSLRFPVGYPRVPGLRLQPAATEPCRPGRTGLPRHRPEQVPHHVCVRAPDGFPRVPALRLRAETDQPDSRGLRRICVPARLS